MHFSHYLHIIMLKTTLNAIYNTFSFRNVTYFQWSWIICKTNLILSIFGWIIYLVKLILLIKPHLWQLGLGYISSYENYSIWSNILEKLYMTKNIYMFNFDFMLSLTFQSCNVNIKVDHIYYKLSIHFAK